MWIVAVVFAVYFAIEPLKTELSECEPAMEQVPPTDGADWMSGTPVKVTFSEKLPCC